MDPANKKLKVLKVIHGYPPYYMAGSEVYTHNLCKELSKTCDVAIFTRIEDEFRSPYEVQESKEEGIHIIRVNKPSRDYTFRSKCIDEKMTQIFETHLKEINPDVVHIGHLSHLTVRIVEKIKKHKIPILFTLHDFWMMCVRGQLIRDDLTRCEGPDIEKCARCNQKYFTSIEEAKKEIQLWVEEMERINRQIDLFIAPSRFLRKKYIDYGIPPEKILYFDYGFDKQLFENIKKKPSHKVRFGFLGRIIKVKGITTLIEAFNGIKNSKAELNIYGRLPNSSIYLKERCTNPHINFQGSYDYEEISQVLANIDVLVVPSVWYENSPLVIHEAFLAGIPVITSNLGGMAELVRDGQNGLLFTPGNAADLREKLCRFIDHPELIEKLASDSGCVRSIQEDAKKLKELYKQLTFGGKLIVH